MHLINLSLTKQQISEHNKRKICTKFLIIFLFWKLNIFLLFVTYFKHQISQQIKLIKNSKKNSHNCISIILKILNHWFR